MLNVKWKIGFFFFFCNEKENGENVVLNTTKTIVRFFFFHCKKLPLKQRGRKVFVCGREGVGGVRTIDADKWFEELPIQVVYLYLLTELPRARSSVIFFFF